MITVQTWDPTTQTLTSPSADVLQPGGSATLAPGVVVWIDLADPTPEEECFVLQEYLPIHPLSFEDVTRLRREPEAPPHFPKVEEFPDYLFVIVNPLTQEFLGALDTDGPGVTSRGADPVTQLSAVLTHQVLVTHHYAPMPCVEHLHAHLTRHGAQAARGPDYLFHVALDYTVDQFAPVLDSFDDTLDTLEAEIIQAPRQALFVRLLHLKREVVILRKVLIYEREVLVRLARGEFELVGADETAYYRNVYDHLVRFTDLIETARETVSDLMQTQLSATGNKLNEIMKVLTMISLLGTVCTAIAGVYGMNFEMMPELKWEFGYPMALGLMAAGMAAALGFFKWRGWI